MRRSYAPRALAPSRPETTERPTEGSLKSALRSRDLQPITTVEMGFADAAADVRSNAHAQPSVALRPRRRVSREAIADVVMLAIALALAFVAAPDGEHSSVLWTAVYGAGVLAVLHIRRFYVPRITSNPLDDIARIVSVTASVAMVVIAARVLSESTTEPARFTLRLWAFSAVYLCAGRAGMNIAVRRLRRTGEATRNTLIIGAGEVGTRLARRLQARPELGLRPIGFLDKEPSGDEVDRHGLPVLGASWDLERIVVENDVRHVVLAFSTAPHAVMLDLTKRAGRLGVQVSMVPRLFEHVTHRLAVEHVGGIPLLRAEQIDPKSWQFAIKYFSERVFAAVALLAMAIPFAIIAAGVKLSSPGPAFFRQRRIGLDGRDFEILKFRTMRPPADELRFEVTGDRAPGGVEVDDRRTRFGAFLRRYSLDELPQLLNVLKGEMAIIGPRPERPEFVLEFERRVYRYGDRHRVKSGLTGWAQVHGLRGQTSLGDRVEWDNYYIENWSLWLDLKILCLTIPAVLTAWNAE